MPIRLDPSLPGWVVTVDPVLQWKIVEHEVLLVRVNRMLDQPGRSEMSNTNALPVVSLNLCDRDFWACSSVKYGSL